MNKVLCVVVLGCVAAGIALAETDYKAQEVLRDVRLGRDTPNQIQTLRVRDSATVGGALAVTGAATVGGALTSTGALGAPYADVTYIKFGTTGVLRVSSTNLQFVSVTGVTNSLAFQ
jgi:hypothetical protein